MKTALFIFLFIAGCQYSCEFKSKPNTWECNHNPPHKAKVSEVKILTQQFGCIEWHRSVK